jgi:antirestriction protein ArdC
LVESFIAATGADVRHGGDRACYVPSRDFIALPNPSDFTSLEHFYATKLHELVHWCGNEKRLKRDLGKMEDLSALRYGLRALAQKLDEGLSRNALKLATPTSRSRSHL